jgi:hypothetical protein
VRNAEQDAIASVRLAGMKLNNAGTTKQCRNNRRMKLLQQAKRFIAAFRDPSQKANIGRGLVL